MSSLVLLLACGGSPPEPTSEPVEVASTVPVPVEVAPAVPVPVPLLPPVASTEPALDVPTEVIQVRTGETLDLLARLSGSRPEELARLNEMGVQDVLVVGEWLKVPVRDDFAARRGLAEDQRLERYLDRRGGLAGVTTRQVVTGDTAWSIARSQGLPDWVLASFNRGADLEHLSVGDTLYLPVVGDEVLPLAEAPVEEPVEEELAAAMEE